MTSVSSEVRPTDRTAEEIFERAKSRELQLSRLLMFYISGGLLFMLLPGTFLGVWNLISISGRRAAESISPSWIQAHGHAQVMGWIGSFILGIGYYSIPKLRQGARPFALSLAWASGVLWMTGVSLRWFANVYLWHWRVLLPLSAAMEVVAFLIFFRSVSQHKPQDSGKQKLEMWVFVVIAGTLGLLVTLLMNFGECVWLAVDGVSPAFPQAFDQRFLMVAAWGFMVPFVWGFNAKWLPTFLGSREVNNRLLGAATAVLAVGVGFGLAGWFRLATVLSALATVLAAISLAVFSPALRTAKTKGVHPSFPFFLRSAYLWLGIAAALGIWAANATNPAGIWGASRHALTVGFVAMMVFCVGQRILPAFSGMRLLFSPRLMLAGLLLLTCGCILRVAGEVLAYQEILHFAWAWLPYSAVLELLAVTLFAVNLMVSFIKKPPAQARLTQIRGARPVPKMAHTKHL
jgi:hypothetical protein